MKPARSQPDACCRIALLKPRRTTEQTEGIDPARAIPAAAPGPRCYHPGRMRTSAFLVLLAAAALTVALPLAGVAIAGHGIGFYLHFPPRTIQVAHAPFAWIVFVAQAAPFVAAIALIWIAEGRFEAGSIARAARRFPWWGWLGVALIVAGWPIAWIEGLVPGEWRRQTFAVLWLGYILAVNALIHRRGELAPIVLQRRLLIALFAVSAVFWWLFEYLNQFVRNWYYVGIHAPTDWDYVLQATLPFSTVLPAVFSTRVWLSGLRRPRSSALPPVRGNRALTWIALVAGASGLIAMPIWPEQLYPLLWLAPLALTLALQQLVLGETLLAPLARGDWRALTQPMLAGLVCGMFWEFWNFGSLAKWQYSVPYVQRFHLFEMPLVGYAGYFPFGLECAVVADLVARVVHRRPPASR